MSRINPKVNHICSFVSNKCRGKPQNQSEHRSSIKTSE
jgi:hypothetical protein